MNDLIGKRILFIAPRYFGYEVEIKKKLEELGANVDWFDERPSNTTWVKAAIRINRSIIRGVVHNYYRNIIRVNKEKQYEYVFFIHIETPFIDLLEELRRVNKNALYILYQWDSMLHRPNTLKLTPFFDKVFTFDRLDSIKYNFNFKPLFYLSEYYNQPTCNTIFDICFIGTIHSDRYEIIKELKKQSRQLNLSGKWFLFAHNKVFFYKNKFSRIGNLSAKEDEFSFRPLKKGEIIELLKQSKAVVDIQHPENNGLTMRTLEVLGLKRKLITTNNDIVNYDFYNQNNHFIINRKNPRLDRLFFEKDYQDIPEHIYSSYSIENWIKSIFSL